MGSLGVPYRMGGTSAETGFDCSGFVRAMFQQTVGLMLPHWLPSRPPPRSASKRLTSSPAIWCSSTRCAAPTAMWASTWATVFIHLHPGSHVRVENMNISYWQSRFDGARRVLASERADVAASSGSSAITRNSPAPTTVRLGGLFGSKPDSDTSATVPPPPAAGDSI